jgi:hypothetical protein
LREKYHDVYASNVEMFYHSDMNVIAFALDPTSYFTSRFFAKAPKAASKALEIVTGDNSIVKSWTQKIKSLYDFGDEEKTRSRKRKTEGVNRYALVEADQKQDAIVQMFNDKNVRAAIENSNVIKSMRADAEAAIRRFCESVKINADNVDKIRDFNSLCEYVRGTKNQKAINALNEIKKNASEEQVAGLVPEFTAQTKRAIKGIYSSGIANQIEAAKAAGMSSDTNIVRMLTSAKNAIEKLH